VARSQLFKFVEFINTQDIDLVITGRKFFIRASYKNIKNWRRHNKIFNIIQIYKNVIRENFKSLQLSIELVANSKIKDF
jgi:hypothetical protein